MTVTFTPDLEGEVPVLEPCLCTQQHDDFGQWMEFGPGAAGVMREAASQECYQCQGAGVEKGVRAAYPELNFANVNASALLRAMALPDTPEGSMTLAQARRGVMRVRARRTLEPFTRERHVAGRFFDFGSSSDDIRERVERFANFAELVGSLGATQIFWY